MTSLRNAFPKRTSTIIIIIGLCTSFLLTPSTCFINKTWYCPLCTQAPWIVFLSVIPLIASDIRKLNFIGLGRGSKFERYLLLNSNNFEADTLRTLL